MSKVRKKTHYGENETYYESYESNFDAWAACCDPYDFNGLQMTKNWDEVDCARCLKKRGKGKRDERQTPFNPGNRNPLGRD